MEAAFTARNYRQHVHRIRNCPFSGITLNETRHQIVSKSEILGRKMADKISRENAKIIQKLKDANEGKIVSSGVFTLE